MIFATFRFPVNHFVILMEDFECQKYIEFVKLWTSRESLKCAEIAIYQQNVQKSAFL